MRIALAAVLLVLALAGCTETKYTETPKADGPWSQANADPNSTDNNIVPLGDLSDDAR